MADTWFQDYSTTIQDRIDNLYNTEWFQANACFPTIFFYTNENFSNNDFTIDKFLSMHLPVGSAFDIYDNKMSQSEKPDLLGFDENGKKGYLTYEQKLKNQGVPAPDNVLRQFVKVSGLKNYNVPLNKVNNALTRSGAKSEASTIELEFLNDKKWGVLGYLQAWQNRWCVNTFQKKALRSKGYSHSTKDKDVTGKNINWTTEGGEGYLGLANCSIDINGKITIESHLSLFGLIPKNISIDSEMGPGVSPSGISKIKVTCLYSHIILAYLKNGNIRYYYYD